VPAVYRRFFKRIKGAEWITPDLLERKRWITGIVTRCVSHLKDIRPRPVPEQNAGAQNRTTHRVGDADNFRLYHTPGFGWRGPFKFRRVPTNPKGARKKNTKSNCPPLLAF
jgi:hypothetical protein